MIKYSGLEKRSQITDLIKPAHDPSADITEVTSEKAECSTTAVTIWDIFRY
jgi:hypothetical protein